METELRIPRKSLESILKHLYEGTAVEWTEDGTAIVACSPVRILDKIKFHDSIKKLDINFCGG